MIAVMRPLLRWLLLFALLWWVLTEGRPDAWTLGSLFVLLGVASAAAVSIDRGRWRAGTKLSLIGLLRLAPHFLWQSLSGSVDVALRALRPRPALDPALIVYRLRLPAGPAPVLLASIISLTPGTLAFVVGGSLHIHILDIEDLDEARLQQLERLVAGVFGIKLAGSTTDTTDP